MTGTFTTTMATEDSDGSPTVIETTITSTWTPGMTASDFIPTSWDFISDQTNTDQIVLNKVYPSTRPKIAAQGDDHDDNGGDEGLSASTLGGVIGGAVALVVIIILITIWITYRLRRNEKIIASEKRGTTTNAVETTDYTATKREDDSVTATRTDATPRPGKERGASTSSLGLAGVTPPPESNSAPMEMASRARNSVWGGYNAIPTNASEEGGLGQPSVKSSTQSYFDHRSRSTQPGPSAYRYSTESNTPGNNSGIVTPFSHARQWSGGSTAGEPSIVVTPQELDSRDIISELQGNATARTRENAQEDLQHIGPASSSSLVAGITPHFPPEISSSSNSRHGPGSMGGGSRPPLSHRRQRSESGGGGVGGYSSHSMGRSDSSNTSAGGGAGAAILGFVSEATTEGMMTGFYGPTNRQAGQTAAGLKVPPQGRKGDGEADGEDGGDASGRNSSRTSFTIEK